MQDVLSGHFDDRVVVHISPCVLNTITGSQLDVDCCRLQNVCVWAGSAMCVSSTNSFPFSVPVHVRSNISCIHTSHM